MRRLSIALSVFCLIWGAQAFGQAAQAVREGAKQVAKQVARGARTGARLAPTAKAGAGSTANLVGASAAGVMGLNAQNKANANTMGNPADTDADASCNSPFNSARDNGLIAQARATGKVVWSNACALFNSGKDVATNAAAFTRGYLSGGSIEAAEQAAGLEPGVGAQLVENNCVTLGAAA